MWLTWIDDKLCIVNAKQVEHEKELLKRHFKSDDIEKLHDYIRCKLDIADNGRSPKMTQWVLMQSVSSMKGKTPLAPAKPADILTNCKNSNKLTPGYSTSILG